MSSSGGLCESGTGCLRLLRLGSSFLQVANLEHHEFSAQGTFPGIVSEKGIDFSLQETFPHQSTHLTPACHAVHVHHPYQLALAFRRAQLNLQRFFNVNTLDTKSALYNLAQQAACGFTKSKAAL